MLAVKSDRVQRIAEHAFVRNWKYLFQIKVGKWSVRINNEPDAVRRIFSLWGDNHLTLKQSGSVSLIYDPDIYLNRKFLGIFGTVPKDADEATIVPKLA